MAHRHRNGRNGTRHVAQKPAFERLSSCAREVLSIDAKILSGSASRELKHQNPRDRPVGRLAEAYREEGSRQRGRVSLATLASSILQVKGGQITLAPPWSNRERLQYVLNNCTGVRTSRACDMDITGQVTGGSETAGPRLTRVRFTRSLADGEHCLCEHVRFRPRRCHQAPRESF